MKERREAAQATKGEGPPPILYLNCRQEDITSPEEFARVIRELVTNDVGLKEWWNAVVKSFWAGSKVKLPGFEADLGKMFMPAADKSPMASIINSLTTFLEAVRPLPDKPVIIIDEANKLMRWHDDPGHEQLKNLLDFLVWATKEEHMGHFLLGSSEYFLVDWLEKGTFVKFYTRLGVH